MAVIERWTIYPGRWIDFEDGPSYQMPTVEPLPEDGTASFEVVRADAFRGAVGERDALRMTLHNVGAWLSSGDFAGWEMVVSEIEATLNHPGGQ